MRKGAGYNKGNAVGLGYWRPATLVIKAKNRTHKHRAGGLGLGWAAGRGRDGCQVAGRGHPNLSSPFLLIAVRDNLNYKKGFCKCLIRERLNAVTSKPLLIAGGYCRSDTASLPVFYHGLT